MGCVAFILAIVLGWAGVEELFYGDETRGYIMLGLCAAFLLIGSITNKLDGEEQ